MHILVKRELEKTCAIEYSQGKPRIPQSQRMMRLQSEGSRCGGDHCTPRRSRELGIRGRISLLVMSVLRSAERFKANKIRNRDDSSRPTGVGEGRERKAGESAVHIGV